MMGEVDGEHLVKGYTFVFEARRGCCRRGW